MDIKEIQEQAYKKGFADGQATLGAEFMCKKIVSCEDVNTKYLAFPDGLRLIFREGKYVGWYVCNAVPDGKDTDVPDNNVGNKWIPVTERLPEDDSSVPKYKSKNLNFATVLVCGRAKGVTMANRVNVEPTGHPHLDKFATNGWEWSKGNEDVTHWMPMPELPKGE